MIAHVNGVPVDTVAMGTRAGTVTQPIRVGGRQNADLSGAGAANGAHGDLEAGSGGIAFSGVSVAQSAAQLSPVWGGLNTYSTPGRRSSELSAAITAVALLFFLAGIVVSGFWFGRVA